MRNLLIVLLGMQIALIGWGVYDIIIGHLSNGLFHIILNFLAGLLNIRTIKQMNR